MSDYYTLLGIGRNASVTDVKKAFRTSSLKHHPDRGGDPEMFKKINLAAEVLSNPEKRALYDRHGENWAEAVKKNKRPHNREDLIVIQKEIHPVHLVRDIPAEMQAERRTLCVPCNGVGYPGATITACNECRGQGAIVTMHMGIMPVHVQCPKCRGNKVKLDTTGKEACKACGARGYNLEQFSHKFTIFAGTPDSYQYIYEEVGHEVEKDRRAPILIVIKHQVNDEFQINRNGDIRRVAYIRLDHALLITPMRIPSIMSTPDNNMNIEIYAADREAGGTVQTTPAIEHDSVWTLPGYGVRVCHDFSVDSSLPPETDAVMGKLVLQFKIVMPSASKIYWAQATNINFSAALKEMYADKPELDMTVAVPDDSGYKRISWNDLAKQKNAKDGADDGMEDGDNSQQGHGQQQQCRQM